MSAPFFHHLPNLQCCRHNWDSGKKSRRNCDAGTNAVPQELMFLTVNTFTLDNSYIAESFWKLPAKHAKYAKKKDL